MERSYDRVAAEYVTRIAGELAYKALDRHLLHWFAERVHGLGEVWDVGCGPGHVARYLHECGVPVRGLDVSHEMIGHARQRYPEIGFMQGDMRTLRTADNSLGGIVALYSLIHVPRDDVTTVLREFRRALVPNGAVFLAFHIGHDVVHLAEWWGQPVDVDFVYFQPGEMLGFLQAAGFEIEVVVERAPYVEAEHPSRRAYICARTPARSVSPEHEAATHVPASRTMSNMIGGRAVECPQIAA